MLNKYPVIAHHFILATKPFRRQTDLLETRDLACTFACLWAWESGSSSDRSGAGTGAAKKRLFAFFNSGAHSGASQPHRHIQFIPVEEMEGGGEGEGWRLLVDRISEDGVPLGGGEFCSLRCGGDTASSSSSSSARCAADYDEHGLMWGMILDGLRLRSLPTLPFVHFAVTIPPEPTPEQLYARYRLLYETATGTCRRYAERHSDEKLVVEADKDDCAAVISYNLALTTSCMVICPRRSEGAMLKAGARHGPKSLGPVAINGTILGGTLMVKTEEEWSEMRSDDSNLYSLLQAVGIPIEHSPGNANGRL